MNLTQLIMRKFLIILIILLLFNNGYYACPVFLTVSSNGKTLEESNLVINWGPDCNYKPKWIGVFNENPAISNKQALTKLFDTNIKTTSGSFITDVRIENLRFPLGWNKNDQNIEPEFLKSANCLDYYIASFNNTEIITIECLKIQPNWMKQLDEISDIPLKHLFIPGTHISGAYKDNNVKMTSNLIQNYGLTQSVDVWSQLVFGIRFIDLNIGYRLNTNLNKTKDDLNDDDIDEFWIVSENMFITPLKLIFDDIKRFVLKSNEIVIIDFSAFPIGFYKKPERHSTLFHLIRKEIGHLAMERSTSLHLNCDELTINDIRKSEKYLVIIYPLEELPYLDSESSILCPIWKRFTINNMQNNEALDFMRLLFSKKPSSPVQDDGWIFHGFQGLESSLNLNSRPQTTYERADLINPKLLRWLNGPWGLTANVVTLDFFLSTNIIDIAIYANMHKAYTMANSHFINFQLAQEIYSTI